MIEKNQLKEAEKFEIDRYRGSPKSPEGHVSFTGALEPHPTDTEKIVLIPDPFSAHLTCFEFSRTDIGGLEELASLTTPDGETVPVFRLWVRKCSLGVQCIPFIVDDIAGRWRR